MFNFVASISSLVLFSLKAIIEIISDKDFSFGSSWFKEALILPLKDVMYTNTIPIPAFLYIIYLWTAKISRFSELAKVEDSYYRLAEEALQDALTNEDELNVSCITPHIAFD